MKDVLRAYRFATAPQWGACLFAGIDAEAQGADGVVRPLAPYARPGTLHAPGPAFAPAVARGGERLWRDNAANLWRLRPCDDAPEAVPAPRAIAGAKRVVANATGLWVVGSSPGTVECFESDSLTRLLEVTIAGARVVDLADAGRGRVFVLVGRAGGWEIVRVDGAGHLVESVRLAGIADATELVYLRTAKRFVVLAGDCEGRQRLCWFPPAGGAAPLWLVVAALHPCFTAAALGSDGRSRVFIAGADGTERSHDAYVLSLDADGNPIGEVPLDWRDAPVSGIAASRAALVVSGPRGLLSFAAATAIPDAAGEVRCTLVTPMLFSPDREDGRRWLRVEATADLPEGTTLEVSLAATDDVDVRNRLLKIAADESLPRSRRVQRLLAEPDVWRPATAFHGDAGPTAGSPAPRSAPLFDVRDRWLWVAVTLRAAPGASLPALSQLAVLYPGHSLMEHLPAIYQRAEAEPGSFLRALAGVLEATTQDLDVRIAAMARGIHPDSAPPPWLDFIARWLGVPWDDGLDEAQKRALLRRAPDLARGRGTRAGLEALLGALLAPGAPVGAPASGSPRRFRVVDPTADRGFATVGGDGCAGSALPAILTGHLPSYAALGSARLDALRLPCAGQVDDPAGWLAGRVRVDVAATAEERRRWEPWLHRLIAEMVPVTVRLELRWVSQHALRDDRLDGTLALESTTLPRLGTDAIPGLARLPGLKEGAAARLSSAGACTGLRLH
jgi:phage tail-like protein